MTEKMYYYLYRVRELPPKVIIRKIFKKIINKITSAFNKIHAHLLVKGITDDRFLKKAWSSGYKFNSLIELHNYFLQRKDPKFFIDSSSDRETLSIFNKHSSNVGNKLISEANKICEHKQDYRTGVIYTTNRRLWEWDESFKSYLKKLGAIGIDMETATIFIVGYANQIARGALLLVSDLPMLPEGIKTEKSDKFVTKKYLDLHLQIGIEAMTEIGKKGEKIKHFTY